MRTPGNQIPHRAGIVVGILLLTAIGMSLSTQGWRSRVPQFDLVTPIEDAQAFLTHGRLPDRGVLTSFASYAPPGTAWLFVPGVLVFRDPRLFEFVGAGLLYLGTLFGVFFLARTLFGLRCAVLSVVLYGLSRLALFYSASLWPRGHPFFYVWMAYFAAQWVLRRKPGYLAAALGTWGIGMFVFMEIAPALFILPVVWFLYRPPISVRPLLIAGAAVLALWYPYLRFEYGRSFIDLRAQVSRQRILPANYRDSWCDPHLTLWRREATATGTTTRPVALGNDAPEQSSPAGLRGRLISYWGRWNWIPANFQFSSSLPGNNFVLSFLALASVFLTGISQASRSDAAEDQQRRWRNGLRVVAAAMILFGLLCNEFLISHFGSQDGELESGTLTSIRWFELFLVTAGVALMILKSKIAEFIVRLRANDGASAQFPNQKETPRLFCISLIVPWMVLLVLVENGEHLERFWWLWPLQLIALAALVTYIPARLQLSKFVIWAASACLAVMVLSPVSLADRLQRWGAGWSGTDAVEMRLADLVARQVAGRDRAAIGYQIYNWPFMVTFNAADSRYKVGAEFDLLHEVVHGISNTDRCAEGISPDDEFRVVQISPTMDPREGYFDIQLDKSFQLVEQFGPYQLFQRTPETGP